jgi:hypothetical protein
VATRPGPLHVARTVEVLTDHGRFQLGRKPPCDADVRGRVARHGAGGEVRHASEEPIRRPARRQVERRPDVPLMSRAGAFVLPLRGYVGASGRLRERDPHIGIVRSWSHANHGVALTSTAASAPWMSPSRLVSSSRLRRFNSPTPCADAVSTAAKSERPARMLREPCVLSSAHIISSLSDAFPSTAEPGCGKTTDNG